MSLLRKKQQPLPRQKVDHASEQPSRSVFSYYSARTRSEEPTGRGVKGVYRSQSNALRWQRLRLAPSVIAGLALVISFCYVITLDTKPRIIISSASAHSLLRDPAVYNQFAGNLLQASLFNRSKLTINSLELSSKMQDQFPEIESALVALPLIGRRPIITIKPASPALIITSQSSTYVLDSRGRAILSTSDTNQNFIAGLPVIADESGLFLEPGKSALPETTVKYIQVVLAQLKAQQLEVGSLSLPALANELHVRIVGQPYYVKFNTAIDPQLSAGMFLALKSRLDTERQVAGEYIDVRIEERAYYR